MTTQLSLPSRSGEIHVAFVPGSDPGKFALLPEEFALVASTSLYRRQEFSLGREAAHTALKMAGVGSRSPLLKSDSGAPAWPDSFCGSIAHARSYAGGKRGTPCAIAAVGRLSEFQSIGIDLEHRERSINPDVGDKVALKSERLWIEKENSSARLLQLFSAKEALFKALHPLTGKYFGFFDAELSYDPAVQAFQAVLRIDLSPDFPSGSRYLIFLQEHSEFLITSLALEVRRDALDG